MQITPRQTEVWSLIAQGYTNEEIALKLGLSYQTVKNHITPLYRELGTRNRVKVAQMYVHKHKEANSDA